MSKMVFSCVVFLFTTTRYQVTVQHHQHTRNNISKTGGILYHLAPKKVNMVDLND